MYSNNVIYLLGGRPLTEQMVREGSTYICTATHSLNGKSLKMPKSCTILFMGGLFTNGALVGNDTRIVAQGGRIFGQSLKLSGTFQAERILMSWWADSDAKDDTPEVQAAMDAVTLFTNKTFCYDVPVRITNVSFINKWYPGVKFEGLNNSYQGNLNITIYGVKSKGLDISSTENLIFENISFVGDQSEPPISLIFASRLSSNKQCPGHIFRDVSFSGKATKSLIYNYAGESWAFYDCRFRIQDKNTECYAYYGTSVNSIGEKSLYGVCETRICPLTHSCFEHCSFINRSSHSSVMFEGGVSRSGQNYQVSSICFDRCYFYTPLSTSIKMKNVRGSISIINCVDESGADDNAAGTAPFYEICGEIESNGFLFTGNMIYARKGSCIISASSPIVNYNAISNSVINTGGIWRFSKLTDSRHLGLSGIESFEMGRNSANVEITTSKMNRSNIKYIE